MDMADNRRGRGRGRARTRRSERGYGGPRRRCASPVRKAPLRPRLRNWLTRTPPSLAPSPTPKLTPKPKQKQNQQQKQKQKQNCEGQRQRNSVSRCVASAMAAALAAHSAAHALALAPQLTSDTGWPNDLRPLGLGGFAACGRRGRRAEDVLKRSVALQRAGASSPQASPQLRSGNRVYRLYRNEFETLGLGDRVRQTLICRSQNPNRAENSTDVGDAKEVSKKEPEEVTEALSPKQGVSTTTNGATSLHAKGSVEDGAAALATASQTWWESIPRRYIIVGLCFIAFLLCNMDRVNMSIAILPMSADFKWGPSTVGLVQSSFFWGYLLTQIAGGIWADRIGGKQVLGFGVIWWSLATMATPIAAKLGLPALLFVRACMGVGEGVAMPAMNNLLSRWVPLRERSRSLALVYSGMYLGSVTGLAFSPGLIHRFSWPSVFFSFGSLGAFWFAAWQKNAFSSPAEDPGITEEEKKLIMGDGEPDAPVKDIPWRLLLSKAPVWALIICHFCHNWGTFILLTWMPTYYNQVLGFNLTESGLFSVLPWLTMALSANLGGWIADTLVSRGVSVTLVRKVMQSIGFLGPAFFLSQLSHVKSPAMAVACMMCSQGFDAFSQSGLYSNHQDIGPRYSGVLLGMSNTAGVLAGVLGTAATGFILQNGSWDDVFKVAVALYLVGTVIWNLFSSGEKIFD